MKAYSVYPIIYCLLLFALSRRFLSICMSRFLIKLDISPFNIFIVVFSVAVDEMVYKGKWRGESEEKEEHR